jgi:hypothetical protein
VSLSLRFSNSSSNPLDPKVLAAKMARTAGLAQPKPQAPLTASDFHGTNDLRSVPVVSVATNKSLDPRVLASQMRAGAGVVTRNVPALTSGDFSSTTSVIPSQVKALHAQALVATPAGGVADYLQASLGYEPSRINSSNANPKAIPTVTPKS